MTPPKPDTDSNASNASEAQNRSEAQATGAAPRKPSPQNAGLQEWLDRMLVGIGKMATDENERLKIAKRLF